MQLEEKNGEEGSDILASVRSTVYVCEYSWTMCVLDSLLRQMCCLREEVGGLQSTIADLDLRRDSLHERLEKKNDLLVEAQNQLENKVSPSHALTHSHNITR